MVDVIYAGWYLSTGSAISFCPKHFKLPSRQQASKQSGNMQYAPICWLGHLDCSGPCLTMIGRCIPCVGLFKYHVTKNTKNGCVQNIWNLRFCESIVAQDALYDRDWPCVGQRYALIEQWTWAFHVNICISIYMCVSMISYLMLIQASLRSTCCITKIAEKHRTFMFHWNFQICCYFLWCAWMISVLVPF